MATLPGGSSTRWPRVDPTVRVLDTRKTTPGLRALEKAAVRAGGGRNHRASLSDAVLVKDNHLAGVGITEAVARARGLWPGRMVEVECDRPDQVEEACRAGATAVLLDNMSPAEAAVARRWPAGRRRRPGSWSRCRAGSPSTPSAAYAAAGVDLISVGALTHSVPGARPRLDLVAWTAATGGGGLRVLLAIDVGNTESVIGPLRADGGRGRVAARRATPGSASGPSTSRAAASPTTGGCRRSPTRTPDEYAVLLTQLLDLEGLDISATRHRHRHQLLGAGR